MQEELIQFDTAVLAKEKGFYQLTHYSYWTNNLTEETPYYDMPYDLEKYLNYERYFAPTQSLLQRWLREVYNIEVSAQVNFFNRKEKLGYFYSIDKFDKNNIHDGKDYDMDQINLIGDKKAFNTFEQALEQGLIEGLKLINNE